LRETVCEVINIDEGNTVLLLHLMDSSLMKFYM